MTNNELPESEIDANRHYMALLGGDDNRVRIRFVCGLRDDFVVSQFMGGFIRELEEEVVDLEKGGPPDLVMRTPRLHGLFPDGSAHFDFGPAIRSITEMIKNE